MIRFTAMALEDLGVARDRIFVSLERNMKMRDWNLRALSVRSAIRV